MTGGFLSENFVNGGNPTDGQGGGYFGLGGSASFQGVTFDGNSADDKGGGFYLQSGTLSLNACTISGNTAETAGPGGYVVNGATYNPPVNCTINDQVAM